MRTAEASSSRLIWATDGCFRLLRSGSRSAGSHPLLDPVRTTPNASS